MIMQDVIEQMRKDIGVHDRAEPEPAGRQRRLRRQLPVREPQDRTRGDRAARLALHSTRTRQDRTVMADATNQFLEAQLEEARRKLVDHETRLKEFREKYAGSLPSQVPSNLQAIQTDAAPAPDAGGRDQPRPRPPADRRAGSRRHRRSSRSSRRQAIRRRPRPMRPSRSGSRPRGACWRAMEVRLKPEHPDVIRMKHTIRDLEKQADAEALGQPVSAGSRDAPDDAGRAPAPDQDRHRAGRAPGDRSAHRRTADRGTAVAREARELPVAARGDSRARDGADRVDARLRHAEDHLYRPAQEEPVVQARR